MSSLLSGFVLAVAVLFPQTSADSLSLSLAALATAERGRVTLEYREIRLDEALDRFTRETGLPLRAEWDALTRISVDRDERITWSARDLPPIVALRELAASLGTDLDRPIVDASHGTLLLTTLRGLQAHRETSLYDVADIAADPTLLDAVERLVAAPDAEPEDDAAGVDDREAEERLTALAALLMDHIDPEGWVDAGGSRSKMSLAAGRLAVTASAGTHRELRRLLGTIRRQAPSTGMVRIAIIELSEGAAEDLLLRLASVTPVERQRLLSTCASSPDTARLAAAQLLVRLGEEARIESRAPGGDAADFDATVLLRIDRARRSLALSIALEVGASRLRTTLDFPLVQLASGEPMPLSGVEAIVLPGGQAGHSRLVLLEVSLRTRDEGVDGDASALRPKVSP